MSGWENIPEDAPKQPSAPRKPRTAADAVGSPEATADESLVDDGELARLIDTYWPQVWLLMLTVVCLIGICKALAELPNAPSWLL
jgi:hypothetical protein